MKQALHIFSKDVRYLRIEIAFLLLVAAVFVWIKNDWSDALLALAAAYIIGRVVHADAIPGDRQFWLTRPYHRMSLAGAKLLFVFVCVCAPIGAAQMAVFFTAGLSLRAALPGLICSQALIFLAAIPVVALAAVTSSIVPFVLTGLFLAFIAFGATSAVGYWLPPQYLGTGSSPVDWVRSFILGAAVLAVAVPMLVWQYRSRSTGLSRVVAIVSLNLIGMLFVFMPESLQLRAQAWLSKKPELASTVTVSVKPSNVPVRRWEKGKVSTMVIPFTILKGSLPRDTEVRADAFSVRLEWPGRLWKPASMPGVNRTSESGADAVFDFAVLMDPALFREKRETPFTLRGSIFLTIFGEEETRTVSLGNGPVNVQDGLQCRADQFTEDAQALICQSFFRWPARLVYAQAGDRQGDFSNSQISYSPFAAELSLDPREVRWADPIKSDEIIIVTKKPLVHFRRDFEMKNVRLEDLEGGRWKFPAPAQGFK